MSCARATPGASTLHARIIAAVTVVHFVIAVSPGDTEKFLQLNGK